MKICPVCNDSFADQLNFCDIDGARLTREGSPQERNKWWSLLGAGLLVGALVITAASILFLPKARVTTPIVTSEPQPVPAPSTSASESAANVAAAPSLSAEPESVPTDAVVVPEVKKKDKLLADENGIGATPNPKAAALAAEDADRKSTPIEVKEAALPTPKKPEAVSPSASAGDARLVDSVTKPLPPDVKKDTKNTPATAKGSDKDSSDKKKGDDKDKKKGGFLRVFKKIFGKD